MRTTLPALILLSAIAFGVALIGMRGADQSGATSLGDVNCSGDVTSVDATLVLQFDAGLIDTLPCLDQADVNQDGAVNSLDAALILQAEAGFSCKADVPPPSLACPTPPPWTEARSGIPHDLNPDVSDEDLNELVSGNSAFAFDLYRELREDGENLFLSPYSVSIALAMTYAGARGETAQEMAQTLRFTLPQERLHAALNALGLDLDRRSDVPPDDDGDPFQLNIANAVWGQAGYHFLDQYLDTLAEHYGAGMRLLDFALDPDTAREIINEWVSQRTEERIQDLIPQGAIDTLTRLVLTNAIYFNASWANPFDADETQDGAFTLLDGSQVTVPTMRQTEYFRYASLDGMQAVELPYIGEELSMLMLLPDEGTFEAFESSLDASVLNTILDGIESTRIDLAMPKFEYESESSLTQTLPDMGMPRAFDPLLADFSGIDGTEELYITDVLHKAFVSVDEAGTEAAAATAVIIGIVSLPPDAIEVAIDRPFIFLIRDDVTGAILFIGRVLDPS